MKKFIQRIAHRLRSTNYATSKLRWGQMLCSRHVQCCLNELHAHGSDAFRPTTLYYSRTLMNKARLLTTFTRTMVVDTNLPTTWELLRKYNVANTQQETGRSNLHLSPPSANSRGEENAVGCASSPRHALHNKVCVKNIECQRATTQCLCWCWPRNTGLLHMLTVSSKARHEREKRVGNVACRARIPALHLRMHAYPQNIFLPCKRRKKKLREASINRSFNASDRPGEKTIGRETPNQIVVSGNAR